MCFSLPQNLSFYLFLEVEGVFFLMASYLHKKFQRRELYEIMTLRLA